MPKSKDQSKDQSKGQPKEQYKDQSKEQSKEYAGNVSKLLGLLKYRANPDSNKRMLDMEDAQKALEKYSSLDPMEKRNFVADFEKNGGGKKWLPEIPSHRCKEDVRNQGGGGGHH